RPGDDGVVAGAAGLLRRAAAGTRLGVLAAGAAHLPPPHAGAGLAAAGRSRARPGHLRAVRRREVGRGRPDLLAGGGEEGADQALRASLGLALWRVGFRVFLAADDAQALGLLRRHRPELRAVLADAQMPGLLAAVRRAEPRLPLCLMGAAETPGAACFRKPF